MLEVAIQRKTEVGVWPSLDLGPKSFSSEMRIDIETESILESMDRIKL